MRLAAMGAMVGNCQAIRIDGNIEKVRASYFGGSGIVNSVKYYKGGFSLTYGTLLQPFEEWEFK